MKARWSTGVVPSCESTPLGDDRAFQDRFRLGDELAVTDVNHPFGEPPARLEVQLDAPHPMSLPEVEGVAVDRAGPLLGREPAGPLSRHSGLAGQPARMAASSDA